VACLLDRPFSITAEVDGTLANVTVAGEIDPATVGTFSTVVLTLVTDGVRQFVIEASGLTFVDSTLVRALQRLLEAEDGMEVTISAPPHRLLDLLLATGLDTVINIDQPL
jgi:anti-anti-sigma factor